MKRRNFFISLITAPFAVKAAAKNLKSINPEWVSAEYEECFLVGDLPDELATRTFRMSPWTSLIERGTFPSGLGETKRNA